MSKKKVNENRLWGMPSVIDHKNKIVYLKCSSSIAAMGIPSLVKKYYPGYKGELVSLGYLEQLKGQFSN
jgi:hypothetical protein